VQYASFGSFFFCTVVIYMLTVCVAAPVHLGSDVRTPGLPARQHHFTRGTMITIRAVMSVATVIT